MKLWLPPRVESLARLPRWLRKYADTDTSRVRPNRRDRRRTARGRRRTGAPYTQSSQEARKAVRRRRNRAARSARKENRV